MASGKSGKRKRKRKPKEHPVVTAIREIYENQTGIRDLVIEEMYIGCAEIAEKNEKRLRDYVR